MSDELWVTLSVEEHQEYGYRELTAKVDDFVLDEDNEVYIKDEGDFFSFWVKKGRVDMPKKYYGQVIAFLNENDLSYDSEI